jgi:type I restriction enzyme S subunit
MGRPMATSQDFVNWVCTQALDPEFLMYLLLAEGRDLLNYSSGAVHQTIYFPEVKAFHVCLPPVETQRRIVNEIRALAASTEAIEAVLKTKVQAQRELGASLLDTAFSGQL